ncbi:MAG: type IV pilus modification PilV family protein [Gaiellaceae bacterium]
MIELIISIVILNVALLAVFGAFNSGALAIARASQTSNAAVLADKQMELYRALTYANVALHASAVTTALTEPVYAGDAANSGPQTTRTCAGSPLPAECDPRQTVPGPDSRLYDVDTYIVPEPVTDGRDVQRVTIVVRKAGEAKPLSRLTSTFDESTG